MENLGVIYETGAARGSSFTSAQTRHIRLIEQ